MTTWDSENLNAPHTLRHLGASPAPAMEAEPEQEGSAFEGIIERSNVFAAFLGKKNDQRGGVDPTYADSHSATGTHKIDVPSFSDPQQKELGPRGPMSSMPWREACQMEKHINLDIREAVVLEPEAGFVMPKAFPVDGPSVRPTMTIRTKGNEIVVIVPLDGSPWDDVVNIHFDITTGRNGAAMPSLNENFALQFSRDWGTILHDLTVLYPLDASISSDPVAIAEISLNPASAPRRAGRG